MTGNVADETAKRAQAAIAGHRGDEQTARSLLAEPSGPVRATALAALARCGALSAADVAAGLADRDAVVRRRTCELAVPFVAEVDLVPLLGDRDGGVVEAACWALGERAEAAAGTPAVPALAAAATGHADPLCREAAVAALGAIGDDAGLPAILAAATDKPAVRRRAVIALAPFEGPEVDAALQRALSDRDWQVRQAAEDQLAP